MNLKITNKHLTKKAIVYVRQSSLQQVHKNLESQALQYGLKDRAQRLGFTDVMVIDTDLGQSAGSGSKERQGFSTLLTEVALGKVGAIFSREASRLSRNDKDWCHLMELCQMMGVLVGDSESVYDLSHIDDQLILGIKGTMCAKQSLA